MLSKNPFLCLIFFCFLFSYNSNIAQGNKNKKSVEEILSKLNPRDTIQLLDLSYKNIKELPNLSRFKVRKLNISHNNLDTLVLKNLPAYLVDLDASHNKIKNALKFSCSVDVFGFEESDNISKYITNINLSNNKIAEVSFLLYKTNIKRIVLSENNLNDIFLYMNGGKLNYLDVSDNPKLSNISTINYVIIEEIKSDKKTIPIKFINPPKITMVPDKH
ncbi:hypothetical protein [Flavobacterium undicola]|uniref:hypothetical protein n=1 Tax=Flavobacterium undicola TaxID=1932779 RepID=UPI0013778191|nr:hypothetical protein [Flavobacterium undicola]MBA0882574.1 hypothetical protein [Flavobacterium undicola]